MNKPWITTHNGWEWRLSPHVTVRLYPLRHEMYRLRFDVGGKNGFGLGGIAHTSKGRDIAELRTDIEAFVGSLAEAYQHYQETDK